MKITVEFKTVYGKEKCYPICPTAHAFARIAKCSTLTRSVLREITSMGYDVEIQRAPMLFQMINFPDSKDIHTYCSID